jgi:hypothetical protein
MKESSGKVVVTMAGFKAEETGRMPREPQKSEIESTDFIKTFASLKSRVGCIFS